MISGADKGRIGEIVKIIPKTDKAIVFGINKVLKHTRPTREKPGGIIEKFLPLHISNLAFLDPKGKKPSKVGYKILEDGTKKRFMKTSGAIIG